MTKRDSDHCDLLALYFVQELTVREKEVFEKHLLSCTACREELKEMQLVWNSLPLTMEELEPPSDLKEQVFSSLFPEDSAFSPDQGGQSGGPAPSRRWTTLWNSSWGKAAVLLLIVGLSWNNITLRSELSAVENQMSSPAQMLQSYRMASADPNMADASGSAWLVQSGDQKRLVVHLNGLPSTEGDEAYQVWMIRDGVRYNAGTLRVGQQGDAILTYTISDPNLQFDALGVTLEPDPYGDQPRGKKVLGTT
jgi:Tfp pilus assembly protein PilE